MSTAPNQLSEIHRQLNEHFSAHHTIFIVPAKGNPPDRYEITYDVKGLSKRESGEIVETTSHVVELTIPFGFPHFPPSCKPKSNVFHPDFDPAAICLGDFWHQDRQLPDLIIYLGQMINGEFYSRTNAFNEEACSWYENHSDVFPLAEINWQYREPSSDDRESIDEPVIDTLDEDDLAPKFDFLAIEEMQDPEDVSPDLQSAAATTPTFDPDLLHLLEKQKRFFTLRKRIKEEDADGLPDELHTLFQKTSEITRKAESLFRESQQSERRGNVTGALAALEEIARLTVDFPDLEIHTSRLQQNLFTGEATEKAVSSSNSRIDESDGAGDGPAKPTGRTKSRGPGPRTRGTPTSTFQWSKKLVVSLLAGSAVLLLATLGYSYWTIKSRLDSAETAFAACNALMQQAQFERAKLSCLEAQNLTGDVKLIYQDKVRQLTTKINNALQSEQMTQGLKGLVLVNGKYLTTKDAQLTATYRQLRTEAEEFYLQENWQPVIDRYAKILAIPEAPQIINADDLADIKVKHDIAQFRQAYDSAGHFLNDSDWQRALTEFTGAEKLLDLLPGDYRGKYESDLKNSLARSAFEHFRKLGDLAFTNKEWQQAITAYENAQTTSGIEALPQESIESIRRNVKRAELYDLIDQGIKAFGAGAWDEAIGDYRRAEELLTHHQANLDMADAEKSITKLSKIILQALIVRDRQLAAERLEKKELAEAAHIYRQLIDRIDKSHFAANKEFSEIRKELATSVQALDEKIFIAEKSKYLEDEYRTLFTANYPTAVGENLVNPVISFAKDAGAKAIFKMQCTETGGGRPLSLVMYYAYNRKDGKWELHSEQ